MHTRSTVAGGSTAGATGVVADRDGRTHPANADRSDENDQQDQQDVVDASGVTHVASGRRGRGSFRGGARSESCVSVRPVPSTA
ncbi:hypothetical protein [Halalkalicoccus salilacus]|uniref:hypothetical protein n=1 Tax=Halalkalicoccus sp. GCM10025704 TaxID=3252662 RepID=UPI00362197E1